jgi:SAM-dependent methyltransferase
MMDAETYDRWYETPRGRWIGQREVALLLGELQLRPGESLLDVACGTGFFTRALASAMGAPVTAVDINPECVAYARRRYTDKVFYEVADARALPYGAASFDVVVSIAALCFIEEERAAVREMCRVARRRVAIGLLNRRSLLWLRKGRNGGRGGYRGARWHTTGEAADLLTGLPVQRSRVRTAIHLPGGGRIARVMERLWPPWLHTGAFMLVVADIAAVADAPPDSSVQRTALRAVADAERQAAYLEMVRVRIRTATRLPPGTV